MTLPEVGDTSCGSGHFQRWVTLIWFVTLPEVCETSWGILVDTSLTDDTSCVSAHFQRWRILPVIVWTLPVVLNTSCGGEHFLRCVTFSLVVGHFLRWVTLFGDKSEGYGHESVCRDDFLRACQTEFEARLLPGVILASLYCSPKIQHGVFLVTK